MERSLGPSSDRSGELLVVCVVRGLAQSDVLRRVASARFRTAESERKRIARELHDDVKQSITAIQLHLAALAEMAFAEEHATAMVAGVQRDLDRCHDALDRVVGDLMPVELEGQALEFALSILCRRAEGDGFAVDRDIRRAGDVLNAEGRLAVFRIVQEALNNSTQHSGARRAAVRY
ncbi:MAG: histidine kinase [Gemmatimonadota bacterium]|nr:histidine kinase [Gemmatimonadota bacterium]